MKTAMILSAGRGERLKPLTDISPKPLLPLRGKPLIVHHVEALAVANFDRIIINHAWLGGKIRQLLGNGQSFGVDIQYSPEPPGGLETAGGIVKALPLLGNDPFVTLNGDIHTDYDVKNLHLPPNFMAHLVLVKNNPSLQHNGDFGLTNQVVTNHNPEYIYSGIACYHPELFRDMPYGRYSLTPLLRKQANKSTIYGSLYEGLWFDIGSMHRYECARNNL